MKNDHPSLNPTNAELAPLFEPYKLGDITLRNRLLMSPLTRSRAQQPGDVPFELNALYYQQRASAGLIISEGAYISPFGKGYAYTPGIHTEAQVEGWKKVTQAVHQAGGNIQLQLWHVGRISHPSLLPNGAAPIAPSALQAEGGTSFISMEEGRVPTPTPRALESHEISSIVEEFRKAAKNAKDAGFDGVQIHGANGYLINQFLASGSNQRTDAYGGSVQNRIRFPLQVLEAVIDVWGKNRVGIRISPTGTYNGITDDDPYTTYKAFAKELAQLDLSYLEVVESLFLNNNTPHREEALLGMLRETFTSTYIANGGYTAIEASNRIKSCHADLISFGRPFISNPDFVQRVRSNASLNELDMNTLYGGDAKGYTDYPALEQAFA